MAERMSDERLAELRAWAAQPDSPGKFKRFLDSYEVGRLLDLIDSLRAALAARPEPIGYVGALQDDPGLVTAKYGYRHLSQAWDWLPRGSRWRVCALIPVPPQEGPS